MHGPKDVIEVLKAQHDEIRALLEKTRSWRGVNWHAFDDLTRLLAVHETAEREVVYPAIRTVAGYGERLAEARAREEERAARMVTELEGMDAPAFVPAFERLRDYVLAHADAEETEVFAVLATTHSPEELRSMAHMLEVALKAAPGRGRRHGRRRAGAGPAAVIEATVRDAIRKAS
jgi:hemerythrin superfamily protein